MLSAQWIGDGDDTAFGWLTVPEPGVGAHGVLVVPAVGYAWWSSYHTLRRLAEKLAGLGHTVLRMHFHGTGNAAGSQWDSDRLGAWQRSLCDGVQRLRELGCERVTIVGVGLGASLALGLASELDVQDVVAWTPVVSGRREARTLKLRSLRVPDTEHGAGGFSFAGTVLGAELLEALASIDLTAPAPVPERVLIVDGDGSDGLVDRLIAAGTEVTQITTDDGEQALTSPAEDAQPATGVIDAIDGWLGLAPPGPTRPFVSPSDGRTMPWGSGRVHELAMTVGDDALVAIQTTPVDRRPLPGAVVLVNSGSEPHVGPGRAWVELARGLALAGHRVLRVDWRGWGESDDRGEPPGRPYDLRSVSETVAIARSAEPAGEGPVVLVGLCAGAWIALRAVLEGPIAGVVALNPQIYWQPGDPVEALMSDTRARRAPERSIEEEGRRSGRWDEADRAGERTVEGAWLDELAASPAGIWLLFSQGDDGLEFLNNRLRRRFDQATAAGGIQVREIAEIDHGMHRVWLRPRMFAAITEAIEAIVSAAPRPA